MTIFSKSLFTFPEIIPRKIGLLILVFIILEWFGREAEYGIANLGLTWKRPCRYALYYVIILSIFIFAGEKQEFIYFQF